MLQAWNTPPEKIFTLIKKHPFFLVSFACENTLKTGSTNSKAEWVFLPFSAHFLHSCFIIKKKRTQGCELCEMEKLRCSLSPIQILWIKSCHFKFTIAVHTSLISFFAVMTRSLSFAFTFASFEAPHSALLINLVFTLNVSLCSLLQYECASSFLHRLTVV